MFIIFPAPLIHLNLIIVITSRVSIYTLTLCSLNPNVIVKILFSDNLHLCLYLGVRVQVSHQYKTTAKIVVFQICIWLFH